MVPSSASASCYGEGRSVQSVSGNASFTAPSMSLSGKYLTVNVGSLYVYAASATGLNAGSNTVGLTVNLYYIGPLS